MKCRRDRCCTGGYCAAFGIGLLIATLCPPKLILVLVAAALVLTGVSLVKKL
jgi:hypothetical protein